MQNRATSNAHAVCRLNTKYEEPIPSTAIPSRIYLCTQLSYESCCS